jgi:hypothetical protein
VHQYRGRLALDERCRGVVTHIGYDLLPTFLPMARPMKDQCFELGQMLVLLIACDLIVCKSEDQIISNLTTS